MKVYRKKIFIVFSLLIIAVYASIIHDNGGCLQQAEHNYNLPHDVEREQKFYQDIFQIFAKKALQSYYILPPITLHQDNFTPLNDSDTTTYSIQHRDDDFDNLEYVFHFTIHHHISSTDFSYTGLGGSTFAIYGRTMHQLVSCPYYAIDDVTYNVTCGFHRQTDSADDRELACMRLTLLELGRQFESFGEKLPTEQYRVISDDVEYCHQRQAVVGSGQSKGGSVRRVPHDSFANVNLSRGVSIYSGIWNTHQGLLRGFQTEVFVGMGNVSSRPTLSYALQSDVDSVVSPTLSQINISVSLGSHFKFFPTVLANVEDLPGSLVRDGLVLNREGGVVDVVFNNVTSTVPRLRELVRQIANSTHQYHFIGSSHMRYLFDYTMTYFFGNEAISGFGRKHGDIHYANFHGHLDSFYPHTVFADDQTDYITEICEYNKRISANFTLALITGAFDLQMTPLRRLIKSPNAAVRLKAKLQELLTKREACPTLQHLIWLTGMPYPLCQGDKSCLDKRRFRTIPATVASQEYYMTGLLNATVRPELRLSVIDTMSFVTPRFVLNYYQEVTTDNHVIFRDELSNNYIVTPGGKALVEAMMTSITVAVWEKL